MTNIAHVSTQTNMLFVGRKRISFIKTTVDTWTLSTCAFPYAAAVHAYCMILT